MKSQKHFIIKVVLGILFLLFALVQYNDPDPWLWISIYAVIALICFASSSFSVPRVIIYAVGLGLIVYAGILIPEIVQWMQKGMPSIVDKMKAEEPHIEYTREFFGLIISFGALIYCAKK